MRYLVAIAIIVLGIVISVGIADEAESILYRSFAIENPDKGYYAIAIGGLSFLIYLGIATLFIKKTYRHCPRCDSYIRKKANRCLFCKADFE